MALCQNNSLDCVNTIKSSRKDIEMTVVVWGKSHATNFTRLGNSHGLKRAPVLTQSQALWLLVYLKNFPHCQRRRSIANMLLSRNEEIIIRWGKYCSVPSTKNWVSNTSVSMTLSRRPKLRSRAQERGIIYFFIILGVLNKMGIVP